ncbi:helix-turn-helix transcriptional regulator [uncultured Microscilla sp.]|uniref:helix-turn-helix domain-containing protein n=1 Tax=uncultured Microscilla sp. TaxID=432653 RepID=UPI00260F21D7|nr:helix-turn-helix transcriptional regulator [uncultured Microscilla sp.]
MEDNIRSEEGNQEAHDKSVETQADQVYELIREKIKEAFDKSEETYETLSEKTGIAAPSLGKYMRGVGFFPTQKLIRVALLLEVDIFGMTKKQKTEESLPDTLTQDNVVDFLLGLGKDNKDIKNEVSDIKGLLADIIARLDKNK